MEFPHVLCDQLAELSEALAEPGTDLQAILAVLIDDITAAVPSFLGLTVTLHIDGRTVTITATDPDLAARANASIKLPLGPIAGGPAGTIIFYAHDTGAFTDLATSTRRALNLHGQVVLDGHLHRIPTLGSTNIHDTTTINRALGVLIARGYPPDQAAAELSRRAKHDGHTRARAAHEVLNSTTPLS